MKKIVIVISVCLLAFAGCTLEQSQENLAVADSSSAEFRLNLSDEDPDPENEQVEEADSGAAEEDIPSSSDYPDGRVFFEMFDEPAVMRQFQPLTPGEELVVLHTNHGDITLRLFPDEAPLSVENFLTHARDGYYDGVIFHRVLQDFMIQGGDPTGTGGGGESIWGEPFYVKWMVEHLFELELPDDIRFELPSINLKHFRGALAMAHAGGSMGSQFYIVQSPIAHGVSMRAEEILGLLADIGEVPDGLRETLEEVTELYMEHGGTPHLDWWWTFESSHIVFGHVVEGMDIVDNIAAVEVNHAGRPNEDVVIERISFVIYE